MPVPGLRLLHTPGNRISMGLAFEGPPDADWTMIGSMLFSRGVTGHRVCQSGAPPNIVAGTTFANWGQHADVYAPCRAYMTVAVAVGVEQRHIDKLVSTLRKVLAEKAKKSSATTPF